MILIKFILYVTIISLLFGEFGKYPFGSSNAFSILDILTFLTVILFIVWVVINKLPLVIPKLFYWIFGFWIICIFSLFYSLRLFNLSEIIIGFGYLIRFIIYSFIPLVTFNLFKKNKIRLKDFFNLINNVGVIFIILGYLQLLIFPNFEFLTIYGFDPHMYRFSSIFLDPNFSGVFLIILLAIQVYLFYLDKSYTKVLIFIITIIAIIMTYSRTAYLMLFIYTFIVGMPVMFKINNKYRYILTLLLILFVLIVVILFPRFITRVKGGVFGDPSSLERLTSWNNSLNIFKDNILLGVGFNNYRIALTNSNFLKTYSQDGGHSGSGTDSSILLILSTAGIIGLGIYLGFWFLVFKKLVKNLTFYNINLIGLFVSMLVSTQFVNLLFYPPIMIIYFSIIGLGME